MDACSARLLSLGALGRVACTCRALREIKVHGVINVILSIRAGRLVIFEHAFMVTHFLYLVCDLFGVVTMAILPNGPDLVDVTVVAEENWVSWRYERAHVASKIVVRGTVGSSLENDSESRVILATEVFILEDLC
jgi:hypothetical protein